ncbi:MAG TPA: DUF2892 domain-containing protein [Puia sp.]|jgi:hypothetical protein|nr:DUF2892 domain-containing protein [Puia sp.]
MKKNMGIRDRSIRQLIAGVFLILWLTDIVRGVAAIIMMVLAVILLVTGITGVCPLYRLLGIESSESKKDNRPEQGSLK